MHVFQLEQETFVINTRSCMYFAKQKGTTNLYSKHMSFNVHNKK